MDRREGVIGNREMLIDLCRKHRLTIANTLFQKQEKNKATYREIGNFEQMGFILIQKRWRNGVLNAEADGDANINSDLYPVCATIEIKLKQTQNKQTKPNMIYKECNSEEKEIWNQTVHNTLTRKAKEQTLQDSKSTLSQGNSSGEPRDRTHSNGTPEKGTVGNNPMADGQPRVSSHRVGASYY